MPALHQHKMFHHHLVGIIPVAGQPTDHQAFFNDTFLPIGKNYLAVERCVAECILAGCRSIWIVVPRYVAPFLKQRLGERLWTKSRSKYPGSTKSVSLYYVSPHPKDTDRRDSFIWSILYGCEVVNKICRSLSPAMMPTKFYVSSPFGVFHMRSLKHPDFKKNMRDKTKRVILRAFDDWQGKEVDASNGGFLSFTLFPKEIGMLKAKFLLQTRGKYDSPEEGQQIPTKILPLEERYTGRWMTIKDLLQDYEPFHKESFYWIVKPYASIETWQKYVYFFSKRWANNMFRHYLLPYGKPYVYPKFAMDQIF